MDRRTLRQDIEFDGEIYVATAVPIRTERDVKKFYYLQCNNGNANLVAYNGRSSAKDLAAACSVNFHKEVVRLDSRGSKTTVACEADGYFGRPSLLTEVLKLRRLRRDEKQNLQISLTTLRDSSQVIRIV